MQPTHPLREALFVLARDSYAMGESMLRSWSGADQADSEMHFCARRVYAFLGDTSHRWVDPEKFTSYAHHIRTMIRILKEKHAAVTVSQGEQP